MAYIPVRFAGEGSGVGELTWSQQGIWQTIQTNRQSLTLGGVDPLPPGTTVEDAVTTLRFVLSRHQALRTRLEFDAAGHPRQRLASSGEIRLEIVEADDGDPAEVAEAVLERYQKAPFDYANDWPVRSAVIRRAGVPTHAVVVYAHLALDAHGLDALMADLSEMDPRTGGAAAPVTAIQPLELARQQSEPAARRQCEASLQHLERVLRTVSPHRFGEPADDREPAYRQIGFTSPATLLAARAVAARTGTGLTPVLLAGFAVALARITGINPVLTVLPVSNRFRPGFAGAVSPLAQVSPCVIDVADCHLADAVGRAARAALHAYKHAYYDPDRRAEVIARVNRDRGQQVDISCFFNNRRRGVEQLTGPVPTDREIRQALRASRQRWPNEPVLPKQKLYLDVNDAPGAVDFTMSADLRYLPPATMEAFVRGLEAAVVETAFTPAAATGVRSATPVPAPPAAS